MLSVENGTITAHDFTDLRSISLKDRGMTLKNLTTQEDKIQAFRLRHRIFNEELNWVPRSKDSLEVDGYDRNAIFFGVFNNRNELVAFLRLILPESPFMLENEFSFLVPPRHVVRKEGDTAEVSRLCIAPKVRSSANSENFAIHDIAMFLYKGVFQWSVINMIRYLYFVVDHKIYRLLRIRGFPCEMIGEPQTMPDGTVATAAIMDWSRFTLLNLVKRPEMLTWFTSPNQYQYTSHE